MDLTKVKITPENAAQVAEEAKKALAQTMVEEPTEVPGEGTSQDTPTGDQTAAEPSPTAGEKATSDPAPKDTTSEPSTPQDDEQIDWKSKYEVLDKRFRALQAAVTPAQQENSRLRKENADLRTQLDAVKELGKGDQPNAQAEKLARVKELVPEVGELLEDVLQRQASVSPQAEADIAAHLQRLDQAHKVEVQNAILARHQDAPSMYHSPDFRAWVAGQGPVAQQWNDILDYPWNYEKGAEAVVEIIDAYKAEMAYNSKPATIAPSPSAHPVHADIPTDMAPGVRSTTASGSTSPKGPKVLPISEIKALHRELRTATPARVAQIMNILDQQMRLS